MDEWVIKFVGFISICSSQVATVFKYWNANPAPSSKKGWQTARETQMGREEFGKQVSGFFFYQGHLFQVHLASVELGVCLEKNPIVAKTNA